LDYVLVDTGNEYLLLAQALAENALSRYDIQGATIGEKTFSGSEIEKYDYSQLSYLMHGQYSPHNQSLWLNKGYPNHPKYPSVENLVFHHTLDTTCE
jgi:isoleucyl-tRNA synthetase